MKTIYPERFSIIQKEYIENGKSLKEVAALLNIPVKTFNDFLSRHKLRKRRKYGGEDIEQLKYEYLENDKTRDELQAMFNISRGRLIALFNEHKIQKVFIDPTIDYKNKDWLNQEYIINKRSTIDIANQFNVQPRKIYYWLEQNDIVPRTRPEARHNFAGNNVELNTYIRDFIYGELLGDGHLNANNFSALYSHASKHREYLEWMRKIFSDNSIQAGGKINTCYKNINGKTCIYYFMATLNYEEFKEIRILFYPNGKKIIPESVEITPLVLRQWFIGDGSFIKNRLSIATYGYNIDSLDNVIVKLNNLGLIVTKSKGGLNKQGNQRYYLYFSTKSIKDFFNYIGPCPKEITHIYGYKWPI